jgi:N-acetylglutamate synthase-like GNAT family acetyltransferase
VGKRDASCGIGNTLRGMSERRRKLPQPPPPFTEKGFYLDEFRGRTVAVLAPESELSDTRELSDVLFELASNGTCVVLLASSRKGLERMQAKPVIDPAAERFEGVVYRGLLDSPRVGVVAGSDAELPALARHVSSRLLLRKLVVLDPEGGLKRSSGERDSFVDLAELRATLATGAPSESERRRGLLAEIREALEAGLPACNLCSAAGLAAELFTYVGSGTLFTRERYVDVRRLGIDDYDAACDLIGRGVEEGFLAPRGEVEIDAVLAAGFGAFLEGRHLAGIGALLHYPEDDSGEVASLYTLTRFVGEGVGAHLVRFAVARAVDLSLRYVFACTTSEGVATFFERQGFARVPAERVADSKWQGYDPARLARLIVLRRDL